MTPVADIEVAIEQFCILSSPRTVILEAQILKTLVVA